MNDRKNISYPSIIKSTNEDIEEFKSTQPFGQDSFVIYTNVSNTKTITTTGVFSLTHFPVTFTANKQTNPLCEINYRLYYDGSEYLYWATSIIKQVASQDSNVQTWDVQFRGTANTYQFVFYVQSFDEGVVSV